ncbi:MarR family winged helix-turn-helix transcriptional regulator [Novosphingopyxis baekryungensis]|jgi:DNA-binding MarR family transcriptional regulator|uniref:MarR family winged helix-turn-helix transcriptional regulator n=1 Tax=Novosphingopyxis baekryungensis TaxID=279369 RepID=UPI0003B4DF4E|nr:MarR family transcriptional regulator [Novosphingopyxis baekryungensis]
MVDRSSSRFPAASPMFLREEEVRRGLELMHFAHAALTIASDDALAKAGLGHAHARCLYFIARDPGLSVKALLGFLGITKQSLGRVVADLSRDELIVVKEGRNDRRQRLLSLTEKGRDVEWRLFDPMRARMARAYAAAGQEAVTGFWQVLEGLLEPGDRRLVEGLARVRRERV